METILQGGIAFILWFQGLGGWLVFPMKALSFFGSEEFFLVALPVIYWCFDSRAGLRIGTIVLLTGSLNDVLKLALHGPRPYWYSSQVKAYAAETSFGVPSGHSQTAVGLWGMGAALIKRPWAWAVAVTMMLLIGLSRLYLGVHFVHDVLLGWTLGWVVLWVFLRWWDQAAAWVKTKSLGQQVGLALALSLVLIVLGAISFGTLRGWTLPALWLENARLAGVTELPAPITLNGTIASAAALFGMLAGLAWMQTQGGFDSRGSLAQRAGRLFLGVIGILVIYAGLKAIFPHNEDLVSYVFRYLRFSLVGAWISAGAPWVFLKLKLAQKSPAA